MPQQTEWKCIECNKKFGVGQWTCADGVSNHVVTTKTYRSMDAPSDPSTRNDSLKHGRTVVCNIPPGHKEGSGADVRYVGEGSVEFIRGRFETTNPEIQYWLDKRPEYNCTEEQWRSTWYSDSQKLELDKLQLAADRQRLENDRNALLEQTKSRVGA